MKELTFPEIGSRFVPKDAIPVGAEVREVSNHHKKSDGVYGVDTISSVPVKNTKNPFTETVPLDQFHKNYKLI